MEEWPGSTLGRVIWNKEHQLSGLEEESVRPSNAGATNPYAAGTTQGPYDKQYTSCGEGLS